ncbi:transcriptional regulator [Cellulomonas chitinilytica]|uniref:Transcriptional regulator n=1 Tax=Cellulomonas chitinilytica TaxID=398759 RepID=A0A919U2S7_9CELL|nr:DUF6807 family protein [Cellulomonas chitinilytica]GIG21429.1 transcriptional regulator [Cellulomonas chitinilytica]
MTQDGWRRATPTIAEVAQAAGVSRATVSRVMNGRSTVDAELVERVRQVADQMHYRPSTVARSLSLGRTNTVAVVVPDLANPMFQQVLRGVTSAAAEHGYRVLVADTVEDAAAEERVALDARMRCDGLVLVSPRMAETTLRALLAEVRPVAVVNRAPDGVTPTVAVDYAAGVEQIVEHLLALGHRHLLYLAGPPDSASHNARLEALRIAASGRTDVRLSEMPAGSSVESGYAAAQDVLASRATAVVAYNDLVAFGLLARLNELGVAVPGDVSITGFDDIELARFATPSLTTVTVPQADLGRLAWTHLHGLVSGEGALDPTPERIRPVLAVRDSTGPVPPAARLGRRAPTDPVGLVVPTLAGTAWRADLGSFLLGGAVRDDEATVPLARYESGERVPGVHAPRPYLHPVRSAAGRVLTEVSPVDHRHHYGVSMAVPVVNGTSYWGGRTFLRDEGPTLLPNHGRQVSTGTTLLDDGTTLHDDVVWHDEHGAPQLREDRRLHAAALPDGRGWTLQWTSVLHASEGPLRFESPGTNGRPDAGYGGLFWRLPSADVTTVLGDGLVGEAAVHGSTSPWLAFVQRREGTTTTVLLVQPAGQVRPWFARVAEYVGAGPALAWDRVVDVPAGGRVDVGLTAVVVDRALGADEAGALAAELGR